jgi:hypothetical protein
MNQNEDVRRVRARGKNGAATRPIAWPRSRPKVRVTVVVEACLVQRRPRHWLTSPY